MFKGASSFNQPLDNWNASKVTDMSDMFDGAYSFNQLLLNSRVSNVAETMIMYEAGSEVSYADGLKQF